MHLGQGFEANLKSSDLESTIVIQEPFPNLIVQTERNATHPTPSVEGAWSATGNAQTSGGNKLRALPAKSVPHPQQSLDAYPVLRNSTKSETRAVIPGTRNEEASQFWGNFTQQIAGTRTEMVKDDSDSKVVQKAERARAGTNSSKNRRRWRPLQL
jgi:hypothetical protein